jgi:hypothetical protein
MRNPLKYLKWPLVKLSKEIAEEVEEKGAVAMRGALSEAPLLDDLLDGKEVLVTVQCKIRLSSSPDTGTK